MMTVTVYEGLHIQRYGRFTECLCRCLMFMFTHFMEEMEYGWWKRMVLLRPSPSAHEFEVVLGVIGARGAATHSCKQ